MAKKTTTGKVMTGVGITAAVAAAAAGAYFLYGTKEGKKQRKKMSHWAVKMKKEMEQQIGNLKEVNQETYKKVVDTVTKRYKNLKDVNPAELAMVARELKAHWKNIQREFQSSRKVVKKMAKKGAKAAKKVKKMVVKKKKSPAKRKSR